MVAYYITNEDSETGKKFQNLKGKIKECILAQNEFIKEHGIDKFTKSNIFPYGGISSCTFKSIPDPKIWREISKGEYFPNDRSVQGKIIQEKIKKLPAVSTLEMNSCVGGQDTVALDHIEFATHEDIFGFTLNLRWGIKVPNDCREVTATQYLNLFPSGRHLKYQNNI